MPRAGFEPFPVRIKDPSFRVNRFFTFIDGRKRECVQTETLEKAIAEFWNDDRRGITTTVTHLRGVRIGQRRHR
jgi:hypothetical protein